MIHRGSPLRGPCQWYNSGGILGKGDNWAETRAALVLKPPCPHPLQGRDSVSVVLREVSGHFFLFSFLQFEVHQYPVIPFSAFL